MIVRSFLLRVSVLYLRYCFFRARLRSTEAGRIVYFNRGAFSADVEHMKSPKDIVINGNILRRILMLIVNSYQLQQIVCLYYSKSLQKQLSIVVEEFSAECLKNGVKSICFGGVDYFEVVLFEEAARLINVQTVAIFHENYTIPLVLRQTKNLISSYCDVPKFSRVYAIGPPAMDILKQLFPDVRPHISSRFSYSKVCHNFERDVLLIPFSDIAYFAPIAFLLTFALLTELADAGMASVTIKHKNLVEKRQFIRSFGVIKNIKNTTAPAASQLCSTSRVVICFNSLVYFEALAFGNLIAIPNLAEARENEFYSQHIQSPLHAKAGIRFFSTIEDLNEILAEARLLEVDDRLKWADLRAELLSESFF